MAKPSETTSSEELVVEAPVVQVEVDVLEQAKAEAIANHAAHLAEQPSN